MLKPAFFASIAGPLYRGGQPPAAALSAVDVAWAKYGNGHVDAQAYVFATIYNEAGPNFQPKPENLNYTAARMLQVWPNHFKSIAQAQPYAGNPEALGNFVYAGILGNGSPQSGDGFRFRGHGFQTTGRIHFARYAEKFGVDLINHPEILDQNIELAAAALIDGMVKGTYTGVSLSTYLDGKDDPDAQKIPQFVNARRVVNGTFNAPAIGQWALAFWRALKA